MSKHLHVVAHPVHPRHMLPLIPHTYKAISNGSKEDITSIDDESQDSHGEGQCRSWMRSLSWANALWALLFFCSGALVPSVMLLQRQPVPSVQCAPCPVPVNVTEAPVEPQFSYEKGYKGESLLPSALIQLEERRFTTPVNFSIESGAEFLVTRPGELMYTGEPSPALDKAWDDILWGRYFSISEDEAKNLWGDDFNAYRDRDRSGFTAGLDMFHQLHCLNQIRQALRRDYYPETRIHGPVHLEHCINHIRQAIMCFGNTAVMPIVWSEGYRHGYVKGDVVHTCRKFEPIREWVEERFNGSLQVPRPHNTGY